MSKPLNNYDEILKYYKQIRTIENINGLLDWDMNVNLPQGGYKSRGEQMAYLSKTRHLLLTDSNFIDSLNNIYEKLSDNSMEKNNLRFIKRISDIEKSIPVSLVEELSLLSSIATGKWEEAKVSGEDTEYLDILEKIFKLTINYSECKGYNKDKYDALLDDYDPGLDYETVERLFTKLEKETKEILEYSLKQNKNSYFSGITLSSDKQKLISDEIVKLLGFDKSCFLINESTHPFTATAGFNDVRITTAYHESDFLSSIYSTLHECGHALYELGVQKKLGENPSSNIVSLSLHESQSRFYENVIGKSFEFAEYFFPVIKSIGGSVFDNITASDFYNAINVTGETPVRIESDEVNYNLHIILRTGIERDIINGLVNIKDINQCWNERYYSIFSRKITDKKTGYLQDIHWAGGGIGYFPTYTIGNIIALQLSEKINNDLYEEGEVFSKEKLQKTAAWFSENLYSYGNTLTSAELVKSVTGKDIESSALSSYLRKKYTIPSLH